MGKLSISDSMSNTSCQSSKLEICRDESTTLKLKLIAIASILLDGVTGVVIPLIGKHRKFLLTYGSFFVAAKSFVADVILATRFVYMLAGGNEVKPKAAESLADPIEYPNLFEDWELALSVESTVAKTRGVYPPTTDYLNHADRSKMTLVEAFRNMQIEDYKPLENGKLDYEAAESNRHDENSEEHNGEDGSQEEPIVVDVDSNPFSFA